MASIGVIINRSVNSNEKSSLITAIQMFNADFEYKELPHWHSDKFKAVVVDIEDFDLDPFITEIKQLAICEGLFESYNNENPLDPISRRDLYGRPGTFFGSQVNLDDGLDGMSL